MSLVVSDAGPLHYLILCQAIDVLPRLFDQVIIPQTVLQELQHEKTPPVVRQWMQVVPSWAAVRSGEPIITQVAIDAGEREALGLAVALKAAAVLMDEKDGRRVARQLGIRVIGTIGVLESAAMRRLIDLGEVVARLRQTSIHLQEHIIQEAMARVAAAKERNNANA